MKQDLIAAYKWGDLAAKHFGLLNMGAITGKSVRDSAILKMTAAQIAQAEKEVAAFQPQKIPLPNISLPSPSAASPAPPCLRN